MAWPLRNRSEVTEPLWCGLIEKDVRIEGTLRVPGTFRVDGEFKGDIISAGRLILGENAVVEAEIHAVTVSIAGSFTGKIFAEHEVEILFTGRARGEIHAPCLQIEPGGIFDGVCHVPAAAMTGKEIAVPVRPLVTE